MSEATTEDTGHDAHGHEDHGHNYVRVWGILVVLLVASVIGPFVGDATGIQGITLFTAFGIALYKAYLVVKNFMHLPDELPFVSYIVVTCLVFMFLFFAGTAPDVMKDEGTRWTKPLWQQQEAEYAARLANPCHGESHGAASADSHGAEAADGPGDEHH